MFCIPRILEDAHLNKVLWRLTKFESAHLIIRARSYHNSGAHWIRKITVLYIECQ